MKMKGKIYYGIPIIILIMVMSIFFIALSASMHNNFVLSTLLCFDGYRGFCGESLVTTLVIKLLGAFFLLAIGFVCNAVLLWKLMKSRES